MQLADDDNPAPGHPFAPGDTVTFHQFPTWHRDDLLVIGTVRAVGRHTVEVIALPAAGDSSASVVSTTPGPTTS